MINFIYTHVFSNPKGGTLYLLAAILHLPETLNPGQAFSCSLFPWVCPFGAFYTNGSRQYVKLPSLASFFFDIIFSWLIRGLVFVSTLFPYTAKYFIKHIF